MGLLAEIYGDEAHAVGGRDEMSGAGDEERHGTYSARGQQLHFLRDDGAE